MGRQMVGQRKGPPAAVVAVDEQAPPTGKDSREANAEDGDAVKCPNCDCEFDPQTKDVVHPGKPVEGGSSYEGADLDTSGAAQPVPGPMGTAADAARGEQAIGNLLANLRGKVS